MSLLTLLTLLTLFHCTEMARRRAMLSAVQARETEQGIDKVVHMVLKMVIVELQIQ